MSSRLNQERQERLEPERLASCKKKLIDLGFHISVETPSTLHFEFSGSTVVLFVYSGWHTGKSIKDGRGFQNLIKQLTERPD